MATARARRRQSPSVLQSTERPHWAVCPNHHPKPMQIKPAITIQTGTGPQQAPVKWIGNNLAVHRPLRSGKPDSSRNAGWAITLVSAGKRAGHFHGRMRDAIRLAKLWDDRFADLNGAANGRDWPWRKPGSGRFHSLTRLRGQSCPITLRVVMWQLLSPACLQCQMRMRMIRSLLIICPSGCMATSTRRNGPAVGGPRRPSVRLRPGSLGMKLARHPGAQAPIQMIRIPG